MNAMRQPQAEGRELPIRARVPTIHDGACLGFPANDNRHRATRPSAGGLDLVFMVAGRLLLGASCIGFIAAGACLLGIDPQSR